MSGARSLRGEKEQILEHGQDAQCFGPRVSMGLVYLPTFG